MSKADQIFVDNCNYILNNGIWIKDENLLWPDGEKVKLLNCFGIINRYDLNKEFPILTIKKTNLSKSIGEVLWIWQKKSNNISDLNSHIWDHLADESGSIGKAYGYQLSVKHIYPEGEFDQVDRLLYELKNNPSSRRMIANMYIYNDLFDSNIYPCAYSLTLNVIDGRVNGILNQRSQEMINANNWNVCQYAVLLMMFAYSCGYEPGELIHVIANAIIYDKHIPIIKTIISSEQHSAPTLMVEKNIDFYKYSHHSFSLENYRYNNIDIEIPTPTRI